MERRTFLRGATAALLTLGVATAGRPAGDEADALRAVVAGGQAHLLGPVESVAHGIVDAVHPAPSGRYVLIVQRLLERASLPGESAAPGKKGLLLFDSRTRRTTTLWRAPDGPGESDIYVHGFFAGTAVALVDQVRLTGDGKGGVRHTLQRLNCVTASLTPVGDEAEGIARVSFSPTRPIAVLTGKGALAVTADGARRPLALPDGAAAMEWSADGEAVYLAAVGRDPQTKAISRRYWVASARTGEVRPVEKIEGVASPERVQPPIGLRQREATVGETRVTALYLQRTEPPKKGETPPPFGQALVAAESDPRSMVLLPDQSAALWQHEGALYARPIVVLDQTAFDQMLRALKRRVAMNEAKQVGLALMMYAQDYDENFPAQDNLNAASPYLKDADLLGRFRFTYNGPSSLGKIDNPSGTQLGYTSGPGGRAIVYADGHVRWFDD